MAELALGVFAVWYLTGLRRTWQRAGTGRIVQRWQAGCCAGAVGVLLVALGPPLDTMADRSVSAHMTQHVLLLGVAAPLLAVCAPISTMVRALSDDRALRLRRAALRWHPSHRGSWAAVIAVALVLNTAAITAWHVPSVYDAAVRNSGIHALEHLSFLATATVLWWTIVGTRRDRQGVGVLVLFVACLPSTALGALMTLAQTPWYPYYLHIATSRAAALSDQQLAGVIMWSFGGLAYLVGATTLFLNWLGRLELAHPGKGNPDAVPAAMP